jgi:hypothetical protein
MVEALASKETSPNRGCFLIRTMLELFSDVVDKPPCAIQKTG